MDTRKLLIAVLALFLGALGIYIYSNGDHAVGIIILVGTLIGTFLMTRKKQ